MANNSLTADQVQAILSQLDEYLEALKAQWDAEAGQEPRGWFFVNKLRLLGGIRFVTDSLDRMIQWVEDLIPSGTDKKAAVLLMAGRLFDYVVAAAVPVWLTFLVPVARKLVVDFFLSNMIDFIVGKYNAGVWKKDAQFRRR